MTDTADAIITGAGVTGAATAFELAKLGYKTLSVDRNAEAGHGSTSSSCAIILMLTRPSTAPLSPRRLLLLARLGEISWR